MQVDKLRQGLNSSLTALEDNQRIIEKATNQLRKETENLENVKTKTELMPTWREDDGIKIKVPVGTGIKAIGAIKKRTFGISSNMTRSPKVKQYIHARNNSLDENRLVTALDLLGLDDMLVKLENSKQTDHEPDVEDILYPLPPDNDETAIGTLNVDSPRTIKACNKRKMNLLERPNTARNGVFRPTLLIAATDSEIFSSTDDLVSSESKRKMSGRQQYRQTIRQLKQESMQKIKAEYTERKQNMMKKRTDNEEKRAADARRKVEELKRKRKESKEEKKRLEVLRNEQLHKERQKIRNTIQNRAEIAKTLKRSERLLRKKKSEEYKEYKEKMKHEKQVNTSPKTRRHSVPSPRSKTRKVDKKKKTVDKNDKNYSTVLPLSDRKNWERNWRILQSDPEKFLEHYFEADSYSEDIYLREKETDIDSKTTDREKQILSLKEVKSDQQCNSASRKDLKSVLKKTEKSNEETAQEPITNCKAENMKNITSKTPDTKTITNDMEFFSEKKNMVCGNRDYMRSEPKVMEHLQGEDDNIHIENCCDEIIMDRLTELVNVLEEINSAENRGETTIGNKVNNKDAIKDEENRQCKKHEVNYCKDFSCVMGSTCEAEPTPDSSDVSNLVEPQKLEMLNPKSSWSEDSEKICGKEKIYTDCEDFENRTEKEKCDRTKGLNSSLRPCSEQHHKNGSGFKNESKELEYIRDASSTSKDNVKASIENNEANEISAENNTSKSKKLQLPNSDADPELCILRSKLKDQLLKLHDIPLSFNIDSNVAELQLEKHTTTDLNAPLNSDTMRKQTDFSTAQEETIHESKVKPEKQISFVNMEQTESDSDVILMNLKSLLQEQLQDLDTAIESTAEINVPSELDLLIPTENDIDLCAPSDTNNNNSSNNLELFLDIQNSGELKQEDSGNKQNDEDNLNMVADKMSITKTPDEYQNRRVLWHVKSPNTQHSQQRTSYDFVEPGSAESAQYIGYQKVNPSLLISKQ